MWSNRLVDAVEGSDPPYPPDSDTDAHKASVRPCVPAPPRQPLEARKRARKYTHSAALQQTRNQLRPPWPPQTSHSSSVHRLPASPPTPTSRAAILPLATLLRCRRC